MAGTFDCVILTAKRALNPATFPVILMLCGVVCSAT